MFGNLAIDALHLCWFKPRSPHLFQFFGVEVMSRTHKRPLGILLVRLYIHRKCILWSSLSSPRCRIYIPPCNWKCTQRFFFFLSFPCPIGKFIRCLDLPYIILLACTILMPFVVNNNNFRPQVDFVIRRLPVLSHHCWAWKLNPNYVI